MIYQVTFIVKDQAHKTVVNRTIETVGGKVVDERVIGSKTLAYPIKGLKEATYITYHFDIAPEALNELDKKLRFEDQIVRFLIVRTEKVIVPRVPVVRDNKQALPAQTGLPAVPQPEQKALEPLPKIETKAVVAPKKEKKIKAISAADEAKRLKALEEKLEELLKE